MCLHLFNLHFHTKTEVYKPLSPNQLNSKHGMVLIYDGACSHNTKNFQLHFEYL